MLQITTDITSLSRVDREHLAGFILTFGTDRIINSDEELRSIAGVPEETVKVSDVVTIYTNIADVTDDFGSSSAPEYMSAQEHAHHEPEEPNPADVFEIVPQPAGPQLVPTPAAPPPPSQAGPVLTIGEKTGLDTKGLPWDDRIHSGSKALNADGSWRLKRGVSKTLVQDVEHEFIGRSTPEALASPVVSHVTLAAPPPPPIASIATPSQVAPPPPSATAAANPRDTYVALLGMASQRMGEGKITKDEINGICVKHGVASFQTLGTRLDLLATVESDINALIASRP